MKRATLFLLGVLLGFGAIGAKSGKTGGPHPLVWDALEQSIAPAAGITVVRFDFFVTNSSPQAVEISGLQPSCGCTIAEMPRVPWILAPGARGSFQAVVDFRSKQGRFSKTIAVSSAAGPQVLTVTVQIPDVGPNLREANLRVAAVNRQAVFHGDCAACHAAPLANKTGAELFAVACGICHYAQPRADMVPDLMRPKEPRDAAYWMKWIGEGKAGTLMPAFARAQGGPLDDAQVASLVDYAVNLLPKNPPSD